jgi:hypothetical protein
MRALKNMQTRPTPFSPTRLARLLAWARLWLQWFAGAFMVFADERAARGELKAHGRLLAHLIFLHAHAQAQVERRPQRRVRRHLRKPPPRGVLRAWIGSRLRRKLRGRDLPTHFFALLTAMRDFGAYVAHVAKRLAHGLTRLTSRLEPLREPDAPALAPGAHAQMCAFDSS